MTECTPSPLTPETVRALADQLELELSADEATAFADAIHDSLTNRGEYDTYRTTSSDRKITHAVDYAGPQQGTDPLNAIVTTCTLEGDEGSLEGLSVAIKDNVAVAGMPMTCGSRAFESVVPGTHAAVTNRLLEAGATVIGKANMDELAYYPTGESSDYGICRNPIDPSRVTGGSSAGSGAAVAGGLADVAIGTDTGGSVRIPAALCGVVGFKPTWGRLPMRGVYPLAPPLDTVGPIAPDMKTLTRVFAALDSGGFDGAESTGATDETTPVIGVPDWDADEFVDADVKDRFDGALRGFERLGSTIRTVSVPPVAVPQAALNDLVVTHLAVGLEAHAVSIGQLSGFDARTQRSISRALSSTHSFGSFIRQKIIEGRYILEHAPETVVAAREAVDLVRSAYQTVFADCDVLLTPTVPMVAPRRDESFSTARFATFTRAANLTGSPALSVPMGRVEGLPTGLQIMGAPGSDATVLEIGAAFEQLRETE